MGLQWSEIDNLRMQKYLLLVRRVFASQIAWCKERGFEGEEVEKVEEVMREWCFEEEGVDLKRVPVGLRLHVLDIWVDELEKEGCLEDETAKEFVKRIGGMVELLKRSPVKTVRERAEESYEDERLPWGTKDDGENEEEADGQDDSEEDGWGGFDD
jgi:ribosomal RNA-processing protein 1